MNALTASLLRALPFWLALQNALAAAAAPPHIASALPEAHLAGAGTYRWFGLHVYDAELWVGPQGYQAEAAPFALDLRYSHAFAGKNIAERSAAEIEKLGLGNSEQRRNWLAQMRACFPDVEDGTHLTGVFQPGSGVRYYRDGKAICDIADAQFAAAFFAIWLDPRTSAKSLRAELLGRN
ncbi:MAG TPA: chalcone isomerase family protein [Burkholderiaceae bacterium]